MLLGSCVKRPLSDCVGLLPPEGGYLCISVCRTMSTELDDLMGSPEGETSDGWGGLAKMSAVNRACQTLVEKYNLYEEVFDLYNQYLPEEIKRLDGLVAKG